MGTVFIDQKEINIRSDGDSIAFYSKGKKTGTLPIAPLKRVVIVGNVNIETSVIHKLVKNDVTVTFFTGRLKYIGTIYGQMHNNGLLRVKQYEKSTNEFALNMAKEFVEGKISFQIAFLKEIPNIKPILSMDAQQAIQNLINKIDLIKDATSIDSLRGIEGSSQALYFSVYSKLYPESYGFTKRTKRPPTDPVNAMLSLCYTMLHYEAVREIQLIGLDPTIGFYHQFEYGRESLACDIVELFRVDVDRFVYEIFKQNELSKRDFMKDESSGGVYLKKSGRKKFYPLYEKWAQEERHKLRETVRALARRILDEKASLSC
ncbi:CRISPR-associated protein Cas1 [Thermodesulfovibrio sp. N1]|uniref:CRISPR-associated endonuclease Cas1 n=1 Tax=Thermodesulfovibrio sp. N1 TaxID=1871110 RepID=UPI00083B573C|nr:CRISPR-associated endonuclease Cas1 [Thermodesulfovibrio sp. N1]ODA43431.1 CRISPR-associated protein Cas1 [Thermodesulfovibrio sp. N1]